MSYRLLETQTDEQFVEQGTHVLIESVSHCIKEKNRCFLGLSGGSTPQPMYEGLATSKWIDWTKVSIFLVDERYVPITHQASNQRMVRESLLAKIKVSEKQLLFPDTSLPIDECVQQYESALATLLQRGVPDIVTLGLGEDGHTASLFPPLTDDALGSRLVIHTETERFAVRNRISLTLPILEQSTGRIFFLAGHKKKMLWEKMLDAPKDIVRFPAQTLMDEKTTVVTQW